MAAVRVHTGAFPSAKGVDEGYALGQVVAKWQSVASGAFPRDCSWLLNMVQETDELRLWEKDVDGFRYKDRDEFLREQVLIDFDLTEQQFNDIITALKGGAKGGISELAGSKQAIIKEVCAVAKEMGRVLSGDELKEARANGGKDGGRGNAKPSANNQKVSSGSTDQVHLARKLLTESPETFTKLEAGEFRSVRAAAIEGGIIKEKRKDPIKIVEKHRKELDPEDQVSVWREWTRSLPGDVINHVEIAVEAYMNLTEEEVAEFFEQINGNVPTSAPK